MMRRLIKIISAFLITGFLMSMIPPFYAAAQHPSVTIGGQVTYQPRNWNGSNWAIGREIQIDLYERDLQGHDTKLDSIYTNSDGIFAFPARENWWYPDNRQLNVVLKLTTHYSDINNHPKTDVTNRLFANYVFPNNPTFLSHDGVFTIPFPLSNSWPSYQAVWIFEDIRNAWNYVHTFDDYYDPGYVNAVWEAGLNHYPLTFPDWLNIPPFSFTYGGILTHFIFISSDANLNTMDTVIHETAHMFIINANNWWYTGCPTHYMFTSSNINCAWSEGWADFLPLAVNGDQCYNFATVNPCAGVPDQNYYNLEGHSRADNQPQFAKGDDVEGRVAGALYDLYDSNNEGFDRISAGFYPIAFFVLSSPQIISFSDFWNNHWEYSSGQSPFLSGLTLWWNTIPYIDIRLMSLPIVMKQP